MRLGLQRFQNAYESKKARRSIPPGWRDVAHTGLKDALREAGEIAVKRAAVGLGRPVDPENSNAELGTANMAFAHKQELVASDMTPFGHWRAFLMHLALDSRWSRSSVSVGGALGCIWIISRGGARTVCAQPLVTNAGGFGTQCH